MPQLILVTCHGGEEEVDDIQCLHSSMEAAHRCIVMYNQDDDVWVSTKKIKVDDCTWN